MTIETILKSAFDWREAVRLDINFRIENNECFSSGELATDLRTFRSDLAFAVGGLGEYVRDLCAQGEFPSYTDDQGLPSYPLQVARITTGVAKTIGGQFVTGRTPAGQVVFVYGPEQAVCDAHEFEVYIPMPPGVADHPNLLPGPAGSPGSLPALPATPQGLGILITGQLAQADLVASVRQDGRLCVSRAAFEAFVALTGKPLRAGPNGDSLFVNVEGTPAHTVEVRLHSTPGADEYHLWVNRGRLAFAPPAGTNWNAGNKYQVMVAADVITIDVSKTLT